MDYRSNDWPKWFRIKYIGEKGIATGLLISLCSPTHLADVFSRYPLHSETTIEIKVNKKVIPQEQWRDFYTWIEEMKKEALVIEERKNQYSRKT